MVQSAGVVIRRSHPATSGICFSVVPSSNPSSRFVLSQLVCLQTIGILTTSRYVYLKALVPLFEWYARELAKVSPCVAKCMTITNKIYIFLQCEHQPKDKGKRSVFPHVLMFTLLYCFCVIISECSYCNHNDIPSF